MPWRTLCGFPPTADNVTLRVPNGAWRPDTVITDWDGNEMFVLLDQTNEMRSYEAIFGDLMGRRLVCVKRHLTKAFWKDGYYFCTYRPNYKGQKSLPERDVDQKKVYPFSYCEIIPMKGRFMYRHFDNKGNPGKIRMMAYNPWLGYMMVCCTSVLRFGSFKGKFKKNYGKITTLTVDQWKNVVDVGPGNDLLAALCLAYVFDRAQNQPMVTVFGREEDDLTPRDDKSINSDDQGPDPNRNRNVGFDNMPNNRSNRDFDNNPRSSYGGGNPNMNNMNNNLNQEEESSSEEEESSDEDEFDEEKYYNQDDDDDEEDSDDDEEDSDEEESDEESDDENQKEQQQLVSVQQQGYYDPNVPQQQQYGGGYPEQELVPMDPNMQQQQQQQDFFDDQQPPQQQGGAPAPSSDDKSQAFSATEPEII